jgi:hypothetical protein
MEVEYSEEGGVAYFPGLSKPKEFNLSDLPAAIADELEQLISRVDFWYLPTTLGSVSKRIADSRLFIITIKDNNRAHSVKIVEPIDDPQIRILLETIQKIIRDLRKTR